MPIGRRLRYGMVGGGPGAFIGAVHRSAIALDGLAELVAGAFSTRPEASRSMGRELLLDPGRVHDSFEAMAEAEASLPADERIDFVTIVTPNATHFPIASAFVDRGFQVVCEKPMTLSAEEAEVLAAKVAERGTVFAVTHTYTGYPMVKQARALVAGGELGEIRKVLVEYTQGWLASLIESCDSKQAGWRTDPAQAGAGAIGDIGSHAENLARYISGLEIEELFADVSTMVEGRRVDDDASMLLRFRGGARGALTCSQVLVGEENNLRIRVFGTKASVEWSHSRPEELWVRRSGAPPVLLTRGSEGLAPSARHSSRLPAGHPEGYIEAFANIYGSVIRTIGARIAGEEPDPLDLDFPTATDGLSGMRFIEAALRSGREGRWVGVRTRHATAASPSPTA